MTIPLISVVIPVFNRLDHLARALQSLSGQSYSNFDVVIIDDGSTEDIFSVVALFHDVLAIQYLKIENSGGPARPRNIGIEMAKSEWVSFLDSDDYWMPSRISEMATLFSRFPSIDIFYHKLNIITNNALCRRWWEAKNLGSDIPGDPFISLMTLGDMIPTSSAIVRRSCFFKHGFFNENKEISSVEDYDLWLTFAKANCKFLFLNKVLGYYDFTSDGISRGIEKKISCNSLILKKYIDELPIKYQKFATSKFFYFAGSVLEGAGENSRALEYFQKARYLASTNLYLKKLLKVIKIKFLLYWAQHRKA